MPRPRQAGICFRSGRSRREGDGAVIAGAAILTLGARVPTDVLLFDLN
jgi:hypothetical protein